MPKWIEHLRPRLASLHLSPTRELEIIDELSQHLDQQYEELLASGASDTDARRLALEGLSDLQAFADRMRRCGRRTFRHRLPSESPAGISSSISHRICVTPRARCGSSPGSWSPSC